METLDDPSKLARRPGWLKRRLQNLALFAGGFFLCALVAELVLRLLGYGNLEIYQPDERLYWRLKPNQDCYTKVDRRPVHINGHGTRGPEFSVEKPGGTLRILALGDSRTFGWGLKESDTYAVELGRLLEEKYRSIGKPRRVEVINGGVNAWSFQQMLVFYREIAAAWHPDMVLIGEGNLWTQFSEPSSREFVAQFMGRVRLKNFLRRFALYHYVVEVQLQEFYNRQRTRFIPVDPHQDPLFMEQQQSDPTAAFRAAIAGLCRTAQTNGATPVLLFLPRRDEPAATNEVSIRAIKRDLAAQLNVPLVDVTPEIQRLGNGLYLDADPVHFNAAGNALIARLIAEKVSVTP